MTGLPSQCHIMCLLFCQTRHLIIFEFLCFDNTFANRHSSRVTGKMPVETVVPRTTQQRGRVRMTIEGGHPFTHSDIPKKQDKQHLRTVCPYLLLTRFLFPFFPLPLLQVIPGHCPQLFHNGGSIGGGQISCHHLNTPQGMSTTSNTTYIIVQIVLLNHTLRHQRKGRLTHQSEEEPISDVKSCSWEIER